MDVQTTIDPLHMGTLLDPTIIESSHKDHWIGMIIATLDILPAMDWISMCPPIVHGLYFQYMDDNLLYIGKSSGKLATRANSVAGRLYAHREKCKNRAGLFPERMSYKVIPINTENTGHIIMLEDYAIKHFNPPLNGTGYGNQPMGSGRTLVQGSQFDERHPLIANIVP